MKNIKVNKQLILEMVDRSQGIKMKIHPGLLKQSDIKVQNKNNTSSSIVPLAILGAAGATYLGS